MSFGTSLHIMLALAYNEGKVLNSGDLARSIGANAVTVRRCMRQLAAEGLIETQTGPGGGAKLALAPSKISVEDIYAAMGRPAFVQGHEKEPQNFCEVSACMPRVIDRLNEAIADKAESIFRRTSLQTLLKEEVSS